MRSLSRDDAAASTWPSSRACSAVAGCDGIRGGGEGGGEGSGGEGGGDLAATPLVITPPFGATTCVVATTHSLRCKRLAWLGLGLGLGLG